MANPQNYRAYGVLLRDGRVLEREASQKAVALTLPLERWLARRTDALIAVSPQVRDDRLRAGGKERSHKTRYALLLVQQTTAGVTRREGDETE